LSATTTKHFLELLENVSEAACLSPERIAPAPERVSSLLKPSEARKWILAAKWVLSLLVSRHSRLVVNAPFIFIAQSFIGC